MNLSETTKIKNNIEIFAENTVKFLKENKLTLSIAESCTGGMICSSIVDISGSSEVFLEGCVTYSNKAKISRLNVNPNTIQKYGAVSSETACEMAKGIAITSNSNIGISTTGIAGPTGGSLKKPVGLVYIGLYYKDKVQCFKYIFTGDRNLVRSMATLKTFEVMLNI